MAFGQVQDIAELPRVDKNDHGKMTMVTEEVQVEKFVSKSTFKAKALELCRQVESTGKELVITDHGKPVLKVVPYHHDPAEVLKSLRGSVLRYDDPLEPVGVEDWESLR